MSEREFSSVLSEFALTMVTDFPVQGILEHLVKRIVSTLPITSAGVTLISPNTKPRYVAASDANALHYERLQTELGEGPCLDAYHTGVAVAIPDLRHDTRVPTFGVRALQAGLAAVFTFPLRQGARRLGALDLYRETPGALDEQDMAVAQTLADVTSAYLINAQARADLQDASARSHRSAVHDPLTGLPNRILLMQRLEHAVLRGRRSKKMVAVLFADLDRFKSVNDTHGHQFGDGLLIAVAQRMSGLLRPGDTLARLSGDEFVVLCEELDDERQATLIAERIVDALSAPFELSGGHVEISVSVGVAFAGRGEDVPQQLLRDADVAMYQAKHRGGGYHQVLDLRERDQADQRNTLEADLAEALERSELRLAYQPIVRTVDGLVLGAEALLRWDHPTHGTIPPLTVVPAAEQAGLVNRIGAWVLDQACADRHRWAGRTGRPDFAVSVNVSAAQLLARDFVGVVTDVLASTDTHPSLLTLEITEKAFVEDGARALVVLRELKRVGVLLALDDFGTGYSSLDYLSSFPIDIVKIDRALTARVPYDRASNAIMGKTIELAHLLDLTVVTEGVETPEQLRHVAALGGEYSQGYHFAPPMTAAAFDTLLHHATPGDGLRLPLAAQPT